MPIHPEEKARWFNNKLTKLLREAYDKGVHDAAIVEALKGLLEAHIESATAVLAILQEEPDEEDDMGVDYHG